MNSARATIFVPHPTGSGRRRWLAVMAAALAVSPAQALEPESPEVQQSLQRAVHYLETAREYREGGRALIGLVLLKHTGQADHPRVQAGVAAARGLADDLQKPAAPRHNVVYDLSLSLILLIEADAIGNREAIDALLAHLLKLQKPHGGWGYLNRHTGDTSMTQHVVLCLWVARRAGIPVPEEAWQKVADWLVRTQDPSGQFGYQGVVAEGPQRVAQQEMRQSMTAGALGSIYICLDAARSKAAAREVPGAFQPAGRGTLAAAPRLNVSALEQAAALGDRWMEANYTIAPDDSPWHTYWLFALERYRTFQEHVHGRPGTKHDWYSDGARWLLAQQRADGSWRDVSGPGPATAFAALFLLRSAQRTLEAAPTFGAGTLVGGRGLKEHSGDVRLRDGRVVARPLQGPGEELLRVLDDPTRPDYAAAVEGLVDAVQTLDEALLSRHARRLRRFSEEQDPDLRRAALRGLGRTRNLDHVPLLISALNDPEVEVAREAEAALRFVSRDLLRPPATRWDEAGRRETIRRWTAWYLEIRPHVADEFRE